jgi:hypothetical protein
VVCDHIRDAFEIQVASKGLGEIIQRKSLFGTGRDVFQAGTGRSAICLCGLRGPQRQPVFWLRRSFGLFWRYVLIDIHESVNDQGIVHRAPSFHQNVDSF